MARRVEPLTGDLVDAVPEPCRGCVYWELGGPRPDPLERPVVGGSADHAGPPGEALVRKQAWVSARVQEGSLPGGLIRRDGEVAAYAMYAPARVFAPRPWPVPPPSADALLLAVVWVQQDRRDEGLSRLLLHAAIREAIRMHAPAVEAYGDRRSRERNCLLPATWLLHEGFVVHREHVRTPLFRLDVKRTARWAESLEHAWEEVVERVPHRAPAPVIE